MNPMDAALRARASSQFGFSAEADDRIRVLRASLTRLRVQTITVMVVMAVSAVFLAVYFFNFQSDHSWWFWLLFVVYAICFFYYIVRYRRNAMSINAEISLIMMNVNVPGAAYPVAPTSTPSGAIAPPAYSAALSYPTSRNNQPAPEYTLPPPTYDEAADDPHTHATPELLAELGVLSPEYAIGALIEQLQAQLQQAATDDERSSILSHFVQGFTDAALTSEQCRRLIAPFTSTSARVRFVIELFILTKDDMADYDRTVVQTVLPSEADQAQARTALESFLLS